MSYLGSYLGEGGETTVIVAPPATLPPAVLSPFLPTEPEYVDHTVSAISRLCEMFKEKKVVS